MSRKFRAVWLIGGLVWLSFLTACGGETTATITPPSVSPSSQALPAPVPTLPPTAAPTATPLPPHAVVTVVALPTPGPAVVGELPAPFQARQLNLTVAMLQKAQKRLGGRYTASDLSSLKLAAYANSAAPADLLDFYRQAMTAKGWQETHAYDNRLAIYFQKSGQLAAVNATGIPDETTVAFLATFVPDIKGQVHGGDTLILLAQGPVATFEILKKP